MDHFFIYDSDATYDTVRQYLANQGVLKLSRRRNPDEEEDPKIKKHLIAIMLRQARALGWPIPPTWDPFNKNDIPQIILDMETHELKALLQNQAILLVNIIEEFKLYSECEKHPRYASSWEKEPTIRVPMKILEQPDGKLYWGTPSLYTWIPAKGKRSGYKEFFVFDKASGKKVYVKSTGTRKKSKPSCEPRSIPWDPKIDLQSFATTSHGWPVPFIPRRWRDTKDEKWLGELIGGYEREDGVITEGVFPAGYIQFSTPEPIAIIAPADPPLPADVDEATSLNPDILPHALPDGSPPPEELPITLYPEAAAKAMPFEWQQLALDRWTQSEGGTEENGWMGGIIEACTGAGKTRMCFMAVQWILDNYPNTRVSIIVPKTPLLKQWYAEAYEIFADKVDGISRHGGGYSEPAGQISLWIINTAAKELPYIMDQHPHLSKYTFNMLVIDEVHRSTSRSFRRIYDDPADFKLGVTATLPGKGERPDSPAVKKYKLLVDRVGPVICQYKYPHALLKGNISPFKLVYLETDFTPGEKTAYEALTDKITRQLRIVDKLRQAGQLLPEGYTQEDYDGLSEEQKEDVGDALPLKIVKFLGASRARIDWCAAKRMACAADLIRTKLDEGKKVIVFHKSIDGATALYNLLTMGYGYQEGFPVAPQLEVGLYHSQNPDYINENFLDAFRKEPTDSGPKVRCLLSVESLLEGLDVPDADVGISVAATKSEIKAVQSLGRVLRLKKDSEDFKEYYFITIRESLGDAVVKVKFENSLIDKDSNFIIPVDSETQRPPVIECEPHELEEIDYIHNRSGLMNYMQLQELAAKVLHEPDLLTRSQLVRAIMAEEEKRKLEKEEAKADGRDYVGPDDEGLEWYRPPDPIYPEWVLRKPDRRRNPHDLGWW